MCGEEVAGSGRSQPRSLTLTESLPLSLSLSLSCPAGMEAELAEADEAHGGDEVPEPMIPNNHAAVNDRCFIGEGRDLKMK